jgi:hypothetical protein
MGKNNTVKKAVRILAILARQNKILCTVFEQILLTSSIFPRWEKPGRFHETRVSLQTIE